MHKSKLFNEDERPSGLTHSSDLAERCQRGRIVLIDDDVYILDAFRDLVLLEGYACETYQSAKTYLQVIEYTQPTHPGPSCVLCDVKMPEMDGLQLQAKLNELGHVPLILMSGDSGAFEAVSAFRAGAIDFLIKPIDSDHLLKVLEKALETSHQQHLREDRRNRVAQSIQQLSHRELEVARLVAKGLTNLGISLQLDITVRTVKFHRQRIMEKLGIPGVPSLVRLFNEYEGDHTKNIKIYK